MPSCRCSDVLYFLLLTLRNAKSLAVNGPLLCFFVPHPFKRRAFGLIGGGSSCVRTTVCLILDLGWLARLCFFHPLLSVYGLSQTKSL